MLSTAAITAARTPVEHAVDQWSGFCQRYSPCTRERYNAIIRKVLAYCRPTTITDLNTPELGTYINSLLATRKAGTVNQHIFTIRSFCRWLAETYNVPNVAEKLRRIPYRSGESRCLKPEEYEAILRVATPRNAGLFKFLANTGLRASEMVSLRPQDLQGTWLAVNGKGRRRRLIPLNQTALENVHVAIEFTKSRNALFHICQRTAIKAGIKPFGPHALRHYCVTRLLARGKEIHHVSRLIGHSSTRVTELVYYHFRPDHLTGLTDCLE